MWNERATCREWDMSGVNAVSGQKSTYWHKRELCFQRPERKSQIDNIILFNRSEMLKHNQYELLYHRSDCFIMMADLLIVNFFKCAEEILMPASML